MAKYDIKVLGADCNKCEYTHRFILKIIEEQKVDAQVDFVCDMTEILKYNVMMTPAIVINGKVVCCGRAPTQAEVLGWLGLKK